MITPTDTQTQTMLTVMAIAGGEAELEAIMDALFPGDPRLQMVSARTKKRGGRLRNGTLALLRALRADNELCLDWTCDEDSDARWGITEAGRRRLHALQTAPAPEGPRPPGVAAPWRWDPAIGAFAARSHDGLWWCRTPDGAVFRWTGASWQATSFTFSREEPPRSSASASQVYAPTTRLIGYARDQHGRLLAVVLLPTGQQAFVPVAQR